MSSTRTASSLRNRFLPVFGLALALVGCASVNVETRVDESFAPETARTFAWIRTLRSPSGEVPYPAIRERIEKKLMERGLETESFANADIYVDYEASIEKTMRYTDPYFAVYAGEEVETGNLTISLINADTGDRYWSGSTSTKLRVSGYLIGLFSHEMSPTDQEPDWKLDATVDAIFSKLDAADFELGR